MYLFRTILIITSLIFSLLLSFHPVFAEQKGIREEMPIYVGFLEHHKYHSESEDSLAVDESQMVEYFNIRMAFELIEGKWEAFHHKVSNRDELKSSLQYYPRKVESKVTYKGNIIGEIVSERPNKFEYYSEIGSHEITKTTNIPTIGTPTLRYSGWAQEPVYRPLVTVSKSHSIGLSLWNESVLSNDLINLSKNKFRDIVVNPFNCDEGSLDTSKRYKYEDDDIKVYESYVLDKSNYIISLTLGAENLFCDGLGGSDWSTHLFYISANNKVTYLGSEMFFLDSGDYDNDGAPELIFWVSKYNEDGYALFYGNFSRKVEFTWNYH